MKKAVSMFLALILICSCVITAISAGAPRYSVSFDKAEAHRGDTVKMSLNINGNTGIYLLKCKVYYDMNVLELVSVESTQLLQGFMKPYPSTKSPLNLSWIDSAAYTDNYQNGTVAVLTFRVKDNVAYQKTTIRIEHKDAMKQDDLKVTFADTSGSFSISCAHNKTYETVTKKPTHNEDGSKNIICTECGKIVRIQTVSALPHEFGEWLLIKVSTCTEKGIEQRKCSCGVEETREISANSHSFKSSGLEERVCTVCGEKESLIIAKNPTTPDTSAWDSVEQKTSNSSENKTSGNDDIGNANNDLADNENSDFVTSTDEAYDSDNQLIDDVQADDNAEQEYDDFLNNKNNSDSGNKSTMNIVIGFVIATSLATAGMLIFLAMKKYKK